MDELPMEVQTGSDKPPDMTVPGICEGYMLKRRKWPLKGWHKVGSPALQLLFEMYWQHCT